MTVRDIQHHLRVTLGSELSHETISNITEAVATEVKAWQARPLEAIYPIIYLDALVVKVRDGHTVRNKAAHLAVGVDTDGIKHVLGIWVQSSEGAKFWLGVLAELANRGVADALIVCCDGLTGLPEAIEATWPKAVVQTCTVHLIRASLRFVPDMDRKAVAAALKMIYTAPTPSAAAAELDAFDGSTWGKKYPATVRVWRDAWERFIPFLEFPPALRRIIYTTNSVESLHYQLRKIIKNRGHFPNDDAVVKLLWLAIRDIEDRRAQQRAKEAGLPKGQPRKAPRNSSKVPRSSTGTKPSAPSTWPFPADWNRPYDKQETSKINKTTYTADLTTSRRSVLARVSTRPGRPDPPPSGSQPTQLARRLGTTSHRQREELPRLQLVTNLVQERLHSTRPSLECVNGSTVHSGSAGAPIARDPGERHLQRRRVEHQVCKSSNRRPRSAAAHWCSLVCILHTRDSASSPSSHRPEVFTSVSLDIAVPSLLISLPPLAM